MVQNHRSHRSHWSIPQLAKFQDEILEEPPDLSQYPLMVDLVKHAGPNWSDLYCGGLRSGKYKLLCLEVPLHFLKDATRKLEMTVWCIRHENEMLGTTLDQMLRVFVHIFPSAGIHQLGPILSCPFFRSQKAATLGDNTSPGHLAKVSLMRMS